MFGSIAGLLGDVVKVVSAPIEIAVDAARIVTKPAADLTREVVKEVRQAARDITE